MIKQCVSPGPDRSHSVYRYTDQIYKVVQFYEVHPHLGPGPAKEHEHYETKLDSSISRTRRLVLEKALCNHWDFFCTFTLSSANGDRDDLKSWMTNFKQWLRDLRKKGQDIKYLIVPERHEDGSWHAHGLISGLNDADLITFKLMDKQGYRSAEGRRLPKDLRCSNYLNWPAYQQRYGFCSLGRIQDPVACGFYITKYLTKEQDRMVQDVGMHSFYASRPLQGATKHLDFYGRSPDIDRLLVNKYDFCATGMTHVKDRCDFTFCMEFVDLYDLEPLEFDKPSKSPAELEADAYYEVEQLVLQL